MKNDVRIIFHIDLNAFYATVAMINEPYLKNKVFVVGGSNISNRGVVSTASYKARKYGIKSGMKVYQAMDLYPKLLVVPTDFKEYRKYSNIFFNVLKKYSPIMLKGSIDEAYLDVTEVSKKIHPLKLAKMIQDDLYKNYQLPVSIGIAPTLFLAKMASDLKKPLGITVVRRKDIIKKIFPLPIEELHGVGRKTAPLLKERNVNTIGEFTKKENKDKILEVMTEDSYNSFLKDILGKGNDIVDPKKYMIPKSISNETTFNYYIDNADIILDEMKNLLKVVHTRLKRQNLLAKTVNIKLRNYKFETMTRSLTIDYTDDYDTIFNVVETLFFTNFDEEALRLVGVGVSSIIKKKDYRPDYNLFNYKKILAKEKQNKSND